MYFVHECIVSFCMLTYIYQAALDIWPCNLRVSISRRRITSFLLHHYMSHPNTAKMGAEVTAISHSQGKKAECKKLGASTFLNILDKDAVANAKQTVGGGEWHAFWM